MNPSDETQVKAFQKTLQDNFDNVSNLSWGNKRRAFGFESTSRVLLRKLFDYSLATPAMITKRKKIIEEKNSTPNPMLNKIKQRIDKIYRQAKTTGSYRNQQDLRELNMLCEIYEYLKNNDFSNRKSEAISFISSHYAQLYEKYGCPNLLQTRRDTPTLLLLKNICTDIAHEKSFVPGN